MSTINLLKEELLHRPALESTGEPNTLQWLLIVCALCTETYETWYELAHLAKCVLLHLSCVFSILTYSLILQVVEFQFTSSPSWVGLHASRRWSTEPGLYEYSRFYTHKLSCLNRRNTPSMSTFDPWCTHALHSLLRMYISREYCVGNSIQMEGIMCSHSFLAAGTTVSIRLFQHQPRFLYETRFPNRHVMSQRCIIDTIQCV